jgi:hypothetical protein
MNAAINRLLALFAVHGFLALLLLTPSLRAAFAELGDDRAADALLREKSATYRRMAESIDRRGGYDIISVATVGEPTGAVPVLTGMAYTHEGRRKIALNPELAGPERWSILIFELTNHAQEDHHQSINREAREGKLSGPDEYGILRELVEFDGLRIHRQVLEELDAAAGPIPPGFFNGRMFPWAAKATKLSEYQVPSAYGIIRKQDQSGHRAFYKRQYHLIRAGVPIEPAAK